MWTPTSWRLCCKLTVLGITGGSSFCVAGVLDLYPDFLSCQIAWLLYYIMFWFCLRAVDDTRVYTFIYKCIQPGVICWVGMGWECNAVHHYAHCNCFFCFYHWMVLNLEYITLHIIPFNKLSECIHTKSRLNSSIVKNNGDNSSKFILLFCWTNIGKICSDYQEIRIELSPLFKSQLLEICKEDSLS